MQQLNAKTVSQSATQQIQILMPEHINGYDRLFGGRLMEWIDVVAAVVARRHSGCNVTTAAVGHLEFKAPAYVNSTIVLKGQMTYVGRSSMEVRVDTFVEELSGNHILINRAYLVLVALDEDDKPTMVPRLILETEEEKSEWEAAKLRSQFYKQQK
ncbi:acyl-CoA thioesterase [Paludicola sp. MB14-C6]|uniref:acyl-CoA thioesterase n=1 Tax=Paludihabitans sp. MB14-C6 TaxID=3070656 RepID=UPI0027DB16F8|nr:acyl-CoA thioesterase [Paludicola sp. MB14-C6]WMJ22316.1 acyl-CoA thioesterase [Paludicola sp. MB14-C6]